MFVKLILLFCFREIKPEFTEKSEKILKFVMQVESRIVLVDRLIAKEQGYESSKKNVLLPKKKTLLIVNKE